MATSDLTRVGHRVNNKTFPGTSGRAAAVTGPATGAVAREVALAHVADSPTVTEA